MKIRWLFLILVIYSGTTLFAGIEQSFKKATGKDGTHTIKNIDFIYTINLDQRPEKFRSCVDQLATYGISPYRFSAVNGWELSLEEINKLGVKYESWMTSGHWGTSYLLEGNGQPHHEIVHVIGRNYFCHCMSRGAIGIVLSHLSILQDAYDSGYQTIWVMEDDIQVIRNPHRLSELVEKLDKEIGKHEWDILFTDQDTKNQKGEYVPCTSYAWRPNFSPVRPYRFSMRRKVGEDFRQIGARYGAYSYIIRRSGMKKILEFIKQNKIFLPYDMDFYMPADIRMYAVINDVISTQPKAASDNGGPNYKNQ